MNKTLIPLLAGLLIVLFIGCSPSLYNSGMSELKSGNYSTAIQYFQSQISQNPEDYKSIRQLGYSYYKKGDNELAIKNLSLALSKMPDDGQTILYLGLAYEAVEDFDQALRCYKNYSNLGIFSGSKSAIEGRIQLISRKKSELEVKNALKNEASLSVESIPENSVAVLYFKNLGDNRSLDPLEKGLTEMIITDLSKVKSLKVVERVKLQKLLDEIQLGQSGAVDASTAPRVGKLLGASKLMNGTYLDLNNENLRYDVNVIGSHSGQIQETTNLTGNINSFFKVQKELTFNILKQLGCVLTDEERAAIQVIPTESYMAFVSYCKGLDLEDKGRYSEAAEQYSQANKIDPAFSAASKKSANAVNISNGTKEGNLVTAASGGSTNIMERLNSISTSITNEVTTGKDDRTPFTPGLKAGVKVTLEITVPSSIPSK